MKQLLLSILFLLMPMLASAEFIDGLYYNLSSNNTAEVGDQLGRCSGDIVIPKNIIYNGVTYYVDAISRNAFNSCNGLTSISIPGSVSSIGDGAFYGCRSLASVTLSKGTISIGKNAFSDCVSLTSILLPEGLNLIGEEAFGSSGLTSIVIPENTGYISDGCFYGCSDLKSVLIPNSVTSIGNYAFFDCGLTSISIPSSVTDIGICAFSYNKFTSIMIPYKVRSIGVDAFARCSELESVTVESGNSIYDSRNNCNAVIETAKNTLIFGCKNSLIPEDVVTIGESAFSKCYGLSQIVIPSCVTSIGEKAFSGCNNLKEVYCFAEKDPSTSRDAFNDTDIIRASLYVPNNSIDLYKSSEPWSGFGNIEGIGKCATPVINQNGEEISFECSTDGVEFHYDVIHAESHSGIGNRLLLDNTIIVNVYATKVGYENSDVATKEIKLSDDGGSSGKKGDVNGDGVVNAADVVQITNIIMGK